MLESTSARLAAPGGAHHNCPDKEPSARLASIAAAGEAAVPFTSGILIGIGETRAERIDALLALREAHARHGHIQARSRRGDVPFTCPSSAGRDRVVNPCVVACSFPTLPSLCFPASLATILVRVAQEIIVQNFRAKGGTAMADHPEPPLEARALAHGPLAPVHASLAQPTWEPALPRLKLCLRDPASLLLSAGASVDVRHGTARLWP